MNTVIEHILGRGIEICPINFLEANEMLTFGNVGTSRWICVHSQKHLGKMHSSESEGNLTPTNRDVLGIEERIC